MSDTRTRLIETAVGQLDDAEMKLAASHLLEEQVKSDPNDAQKAIARWNAVDGKPSRRFWKWGLWLGLFAATAFVGTRDFREVRRYVAWREWIGGNYSTSSVKRDNDSIDQLSPAQQLLLGGSTSSEALWRSDPENPAYFVEYAGQFASEHRSLPPDFLETARQLDPDNAWFTWFAASVEAKGGLENKSVKHKEPDGTVRDVDAWTVLDQARVDRASALIVAARSQPKFENYANAMLLKRQALLPQHNLVEHMDGIGRISETPFNPNLKLMDAVFLLVGRSKLAAEGGDVASFQGACQDGDRLLRHMAGTEAGTLLSGVIESGFLNILSQRFSEGAEKLGMESDATRWKAILDAAMARKKSARSHGFLVDGKAADPDLVAGMMFGNSFEVGPNAVERPPTLTDADLKPGRMLDHEILSRFCGYLSWVVMGFCLLSVAVYRFRVSRLGRWLAGRIEQLLDGWDWAWVLGAGIVLPLAFVMMVNRLSPLGGRQFGMVGNAMLLPAGHFFGLIVLWLIVPAQIVRSRLAKRAGVFEFSKPSWIGWFAAISATAFIPLIGWAVIHRSFPPFWANWVKGWYIEMPLADETWRFWVASGTLGLPILWLIAGALGALLRRHSQIIQPATTARVLIKPFAVAMLLLALATIAFKSSERWWFQRDRMIRWDPARPGWSGYEADLARQLKKELRETLGFGNFGK